VCDQAAWNRSTRRAGDRGGARAGKYRCVRILVNHRGGDDRGDDLQAATTVWAVFDIDIEYPAAALTAEDLAAVQQQVRRRVLRWFARAGHLDAADARDMARWDHGGGAAFIASLAAPKPLHKPRATAANLRLSRGRASTFSPNARSVSATLAIVRRVLDACSIRRFLLHQLAPQDKPGFLRTAASSADR